MSKSTINGGNERDAIVRLPLAPQEPQTPVERLAVAMLRREIAIPFNELVKRVADEWYQEEMAAGGSLVDLGLFGSALFFPDVSREIQAGDGKLWHISRST